MTTEPTTAPAAAPAAPPSPTAPAWLGESPDPEFVGHVQNKGWASPADAVKSHRELEKLFGADRAGRTVVLPPEDDAVGQEQFWSKLGRPATPDDYGLDKLEGADPNYAKAMADAMHKAGIPAKQAKAIAEAHGLYMQTALEAQGATTTAQLEAEDTALKKDWGAEYANRRDLARRAAMHLGLEVKDIDILEKSGGYSKTLKALAKVGDMLKEHKLEGFESPGSYGMTPEGAKAKRTQLMADSEWRNRAMNLNSREWAELQKLDGIIAGA